MDAGTVIQDRYRLDALLGTGGMAEVWSATDDRLQRRVAVKFLATPLADDPTFLVRFFSEAQAVAKISHPNVVSVLDFGEFEDRPYLVMEHVAGGSVSDMIGPPWPPDKALALVADAARGAGAAHAHGIIHRDLKPANILITEEGDPKIADFGIAASLAGEKLTATGAAIGSPHYISPEQAAGGTAVPASDVYSLGVVLYELLTGTKPFDGNNITAIVIAQVEQEPRPAKEIVSDLPQEVDALVLRALAKDPSERFQDGDDFAAALESETPVTGPLPLLLREPDPDDDAIEVVKFAGKRALVSTLVTLLLLGAAAAAIVSLRRPNAERGPRTTIEDTRPVPKRDRASPVAEVAAPAPTRSPTPPPRATKQQERRERETKEVTVTTPGPDEPQEPTPGPEQSGGSVTQPTPEPSGASPEP